MLFGISRSVATSDAVSVFKLQEHSGLRMSGKLCLNLCSLKGDRPIQSLVSNCNPADCGQNVSKCNDRIKRL